MRAASHRQNEVNIRDLCPLCRVYDPSWFVHVASCPLRRPREMWRPALVAAMYRRRLPRITAMEKVARAMWQADQANLRFERAREDGR
jgi:hypothetical protein